MQCELLLRVYDHDVHTPVLSGLDERAGEVLLPKVDGCWPVQPRWARVRMIRIVDGGELLDLVVREREGFHAGARVSEVIIEKLDEFRGVVSCRVLLGVGLESEAERAQLARPGRGIVSACVR